MNNIAPGEHDWLDKMMNEDKLLQWITGKKEPLKMEVPEATRADVLEEMTPKFSEFQDTLQLLKAQAVKKERVQMIEKLLGLRS